MSHALSNIEVLQVGKLTGEPGFGRRLIERLQTLHIFELTDDPLNAQAVLDVHGEDDDEGFTGTLIIRARDGHEIWRSTARRPHGTSGPMAYERLLADLRSAAQPALERSRND